MSLKLGDWAAQFSQLSNFEDLRNDLVAIEAGEYLRSKRLTMQQPFQEPLLAALGGIPFTLREEVKKDIHKWKEFGITPTFVFSGLSAVRKDSAFQAQEWTAREIEKAWRLYSQNQAQDAVKTFGSSGAPRLEEFYPFLQVILKEESVDFQVAPYSAGPQLAYLVSGDGLVVDVVYGSAETLLYDVPRLITKWDFENNQFTWVQRSSCIAELGPNSSPDLFVDAALLSGFSLLPPLPPLLSRSQQKSEIKRAVDLLNQHQRNGHLVCLSFQDDPQTKKLNYLSLYQSTRMAIKHGVVQHIDGKIQPLNHQILPNDAHSFISNRLPEELHFYLSKGLVGTRVLNWVASGEILEFAPLDNGTSSEYRQLVSSKLPEVRTATLALLSNSLNRYFANRNLSFSTWFEPTNVRSIAIKGRGDLSKNLATWHVNEAAYGGSAEKGVLQSCISAFKDSSFSKKSITPQSPGSASKPLTTKEEVLRNSVWRLLHLRNYVDDKHTLTPAGDMLATALSTIGDKKELEVPVFLAVELLRYELLNSDNMFDYDGAPFRGTEIDKRNSLLVARVACFGSLQHSSIGFTGPLSRHLLGYNSMISAVRASVRDLAEVCLVTQLLSGEVDRDLDPTTLGHELPFLLQNDCALGLAVKTYLEEMLIANGPVEQEAKDAALKTVKGYFPYALDFKQDLSTAFELWDAVYAAVRASKSSVKDRNVWDEANAWLAGYR